MYTICAITTMSRQTGFVYSVFKLERILIMSIYRYAFLIENLSLYASLRHNIIQQLLFLIVLINAIRFHVTSPKNVDNITHSFAKVQNEYFSTIKLHKNLSTSRSPKVSPKYSRIVRAATKRRLFFSKSLLLTSSHTWAAAE